jgi:hypothetical protein
MKTHLFLSVTGFIAVLGAALPAFSQSWPAGVTPVRGVVESSSGDLLTVNSKTGPVKIRLGSPLQVYRDIPSDLAHVNSSSYVGVLSFKQPDGSERAKEIYIFPEELHGTGEGSFLLNQSQPNTESNSRMTNGTVNAKLEASKLTVQYNGGVQTISVHPDVTVVALTVSPEQLKPGENVLVLAKNQPDGSLTTTKVISTK